MASQIDKKQIYKSHKITTKTNTFSSLFFLFFGLTRSFVPKTNIMVGPIQYSPNHWYHNLQNLVSQHLRGSMNQPRILSNMGWSINSLADGRRVGSRSIIVCFKIHSQKLCLGYYVQMLGTAMKTQRQLSKQRTLSSCCNCNEWPGRRGSLPSLILRDWFLDSVRGDPLISSYTVTPKEKMSTLSSCAQFSFSIS